MGAPSFAENLAALPPVDHLERLDLYVDGSEAPSAVIENAPGKQGSLRVYYALAVEFGGIGPAAARKGLELYAEHVADARAHPGRHPNIDRLFDVIASGRIFAVRAVRRT
ncbi:MAG TPA: DUF2322 family protein [Pelomicrobium sp.]|nr:DUF2322 family protein [Pelomicrobium sp.]